MTLVQKIIIIGMAVLGTAMTRFLPFLIFPGDRPVPKYVQYLGKVLPSAVFCGFRAAGRLLSAECKHSVRKSRNSGIDFHCGRCGASSLETADAAVHRRRNDLLYDAGADGVLTGLTYYIRSAILTALKGR